jgi:filamin
LKDEGVKPNPEDFEVKIESPNGSDVPVDIVDNDDGTYGCKYTPNEPGRHKLRVGLKGKPILSNHAIPVDKSKTDASCSTASGPGIEPGNLIDEKTHFTIQARNRIGDPMKTGGDQFKVTVQGPHDSIVDNQLTDNSDGTYKVEYEPTVPGDHKIEVSLNGVHIVGSPFNVVVERGENAPDPSQFEVFGKGIEGGDTADPCEFTVVAKNSKGEKLPTGGHAVECEVFGPTGNEIPVKLVDNNDGTYSVSYQPLDPGNHQVDVILRTKIPLFYDHIKDSPYTVIVSGTDNSASLVWGPGLEDVYDTKPTEFYIKSKDRDGNDMGRGGDPYKVTIDGPNGPVPCEIKDNQDGTYTVSYAPEDHGDHVIQVNLRDKPVAKSPYTVNVKEGADWHHTRIEKFQFTIQSKTKAGNNKLNGGESFAVNVNKESGEAVEDVKVCDLTDGTYICDYSLPGPGNYSISVKINGHDICGSPFSQNLP